MAYTIEQLVFLMEVSQESVFLERLRTLKNVITVRMIYNYVFCKMFYTYPMLIVSVIASKFCTVIVFVFVGEQIIFHAVANA
jgi:hypothetical protein